MQVLQCLEDHSRWSTFPEGRLCCLPPIHFPEINFSPYQDSVHNCLQSLRIEKSPSSLHHLPNLYLIGSYSITKIICALKPDNICELHLTTLPSKDRII